MPFFKRSKQETLADSIQEISQNTNITKLTPGSKIRAILDTVSSRLEENYNLFSLDLARAFVSSSSGQFLDLIGELLGVSRNPSEAANVSEDMETIQFSVDGGGTFGSINSGADIVIPTGTHITTQPNNNGIIYVVNQNKVLVASATQDFVSASAISPGENLNVGINALKYHTFVNYTDSDNRTLLVTNLHGIQNGKNFESEANFRYRIINQALSAEAANETAIRLSALSTPGVADVQLIRHYRGIGTWAIIIKSLTPTVSQNLITNVTANVQEVSAFGEVMFIQKPRETGLTLRTTVHYTSRLDDDTITDIEDALESAITNYVNNLDLGESFIINRLVSNIFNVSPLIANLGEAGKPLDEIYVYRESRLQDNKIREKLLGDYHPQNYERVIIEPSVKTPIIFERAFTRR